MKSVQAVIFFFYCVVFFYVAVLLEGSAQEKFFVTLFVISASVSFLVKVSKMPKVLEDACISSGAFGVRDRVGVFGLFLISFMGMIYIYASSGVPILSDNVEVSRMELVENYGLLYRMCVQSFNLLGLVGLYYFLIFSSSFFLFLLGQLIIVICVFSLGFRSMVADYLIVIALGYVVLGVSNNRFTVMKLLKTALLGGLGGAVALVAITYLTFVREGQDDFLGAFFATIYRVFILNYQVNFWRICDYVDVFGFFYGLTFLTDVLAAASGSFDSMQEMVTKYFNNVNSDLFIMTPTIYGEFYLNFGYFSALLVFPMVVFYRFTLERLVLFVYRTGRSKVVFFALGVNVIYFFPRIAVTGGVSNAFLINFGSLMFISACVFGMILLSRLFLMRT